MFRSSGRSSAEPGPVSWRRSEEPINQLFFERCKKTFHPRIVKTAMCAAHALPDGTEPGNHRPVLLTGVLAAVVGVQDQTLLITIA